MLFLLFDCSKKPYLVFLILFILNRTEYIEIKVSKFMRTETASHFLFSCPNYHHLRIRYLANLTQPLTLSVALSGIPDASVDCNDTLFKQVQQFILASKRFA